MHLNDWLQSQSTSTATPAAAQRCMKLSRRVCDCMSEHEVWQRGEKSEKGGAGGGGDGVGGAIHSNLGCVSPG